jgi:Flp pilus assembly pilin Flp
MRQLFLVLLIDDGGQSLVEYALIIGLVSVAAISALHLLGNKTNNTLFNTITCGMSGIP